MFATPTCFLLREPLLEAHGEGGVGGGGNAAANGNVLSGLGVGLRGADCGRCSDTKALAPVLPNKQDNNRGAGSLKV